MKQHMPIIAVFLVSLTTLVGGCEDSIVKDAKKRHAEYVGAKPKQIEIIGSYVLTDQTVVPGGVSVFGGGSMPVGHSCQRHVHYHELPGHQSTGFRPPHFHFDYRALGAQEHWGFIWLRANR